jgi:hypothetical protein
MARAKNGNGTSILALLPSGRRQEILDEASGQLARKIFSAHTRSTLGDLVKSFESNRQWSSLRKVSVAVVLREPSSQRRAHEGRRRRRGPIAAALLDKIVAVIARKPGLRSEQLRDLVAAPAPLVKAGLAKLRVEKRVKTKGQKRATTYTVA